MATEDSTKDYGVLAGIFNEDLSGGSGELTVGKDRVTIPQQDGSSMLIRHPSHCFEYSAFAGKQKYVRYNLCNEEPAF
ncbi:MAG: hypothetical protein QGH37_29560 [Candidatus Poribacteria bacterium]|nr:hypothetical protein [Candidatus Poribacteria bacterium]